MLSNKGLEDYFLPLALKHGGFSGLYCLSGWSGKAKSWDPQTTKVDPHTAAGPAACSVMPSFGMLMVSAQVGWAKGSI